MIYEHEKPQWIYIEGGTDELGENPVTIQICPPQIPHGLTRKRTQAIEVRNRRLTSSAMALPKE
jgi:hypothetical protein